MSPSSPWLCHPLLIPSPPHQRTPGNEPGGRGEDEDDSQESVCHQERLCITGKGRQDPATRGSHRTRPLRQVWANRSPPRCRPCMYSPRTESEPAHRPGSGQHRSTDRRWNAPHRPAGPCATARGQSGRHPRSKLGVREDVALVAAAATEPRERRPVPCSKVALYWHIATDKQFLARADIEGLELIHEPTKQSRAHMRPLGACPLGDAITPIHTQEATSIQLRTGPVVVHFDRSYRPTSTSLRRVQAIAQGLPLLPVPGRDVSPAGI